MSQIESFNCYELELEKAHSANKIIQMSPAQIESFKRHELYEVSLKINANARTQWVIWMSRTQWVI